MYMTLIVALELFVFFCNQMSGQRSCRFITASTLREKILVLRVIFKALCKGYSWINNLFSFLSSTSNIEFPAESFVEATIPLNKSTRHLLTDTLAVLCCKVCLCSSRKVWANLIVSNVKTSGCEFFKLLSFVFCIVSFAFLFRSLRW